MRLVTDTRDIEIRDGDVLLIQCDEQLTVEHAAALKHRVREALGCDAVIFAGSVRLGDVMADGGTPIYASLCALEAQ